MSRSIRSWLFLLVLVAWGCILSVSIFNPWGLGQRVFWGMKPPYRWVRLDERRADYVGANGKSCATIYEYSGKWTVYGYGFSWDGPSRDEAVKVAERECR